MKGVKVFKKQKLKKKKKETTNNKKKMSKKKKNQTHTHTRLPTGKKKETLMFIHLFVVKD